MISYINNLYLTEKTKKRLDRIIKDIADKKFLSLACIIVLSENEKDVFDIIPINNLKLRKDSISNILVLGIAENKKAAMRLCSSMIGEYLESGSGKNMRDYFKDKE